MTNEELIQRLDNLYTMLEEEGYYTKANTASRDNRPTWQEWKDIFATGYEQKARAERLVKEGAEWATMCADHHDKWVAETALAAEKAKVAALEWFAEISAEQALETKARLAALTQKDRTDG